MLATTANEVFIRLTTRGHPGYCWVWLEGDGKGAQG